MTLIVLTALELLVLLLIALMVWAIGDQLSKKDE
jgi:hypothetical protein|tara:strand:- start:233 stop:334 length:102 start_codon:yes stop_codon:yes gene_type:complete